MDMSKAYEAGKIDAKEWLANPDNACEPLPAINARYVLVNGWDIAAVSLGVELPRSVWSLDSWRSYFEAYEDGWDNEVASRD